MTTEGDWFEAFNLLRIKVGAPFPAFPLFPAKKGGKWINAPARLQDFNQGVKWVTAENGFADA
eukprot:8120648-Karenia_brevis.AAC.1